MSYTFSFSYSFSDDHLLLKSSVLSYSASSQGPPWHTPQAVPVVTELCAGRSEPAFPFHSRCLTSISDVVLETLLRILQHPNPLFLLAWNDFFKAFSFLFLGLNILSKPQKLATLRVYSNIFIILLFHGKGRRSTCILLSLIKYIKKSMNSKSAVISTGQLKNPSSLNCCFCCRQLAIFPRYMSCQKCPHSLQYIFNIPSMFY